MKIESAALLRLIPGYDIVKVSEQQMRRKAFTQTELATIPV